MVKVSPSAEKKITGNNRAFTSSVTVDFSGLRFDKSVAISAPASVENCAPEQIVDPASAYRENWWFLGQKLPLVPVRHKINKHKNKGYVPRQHEGGEKIGYIGKLADSSGNVNDSVSVRFGKRQVSKITLSSPSDKLLIDYKIDVLFNGKVLAQVEKQSNALASETLHIDPVIANELKITVTKCTPGRRVSILNLNPSLFKNYESDDIIDWSYELRRSSGGSGLGDVYIGSLRLKFWNSCHSYDPDNTSSRFHGMLSGGESVSVSLSQCEIGFPAGVFFANQWQVSDGVVDCQATDTLGMVKSQKLTPDIVSDTNAYEAFKYIAGVLNFSHSEIDPALKLVKFNDFCPMGTIGASLSDLCRCSNSICFMNASGTGLTVKKIDQLLSSKRYPDRYLGLDDYVKADEKSDLKTPNVVKLTFGLFEKEVKKEVIKKIVKRYKDIPSLEYPDPLKLVPAYNREIGAGLQPSWILRDEIPEETQEIEFSDAFSYGSLEYYTTKENDKWLVKIWNFGNTSEEEQLSVLCLGNPAADKPILLADTKHEIPINPSRTKNKIIDEPVVVEHAMNDRIRIQSVVPGNIQIKDKFEFTIAPTGTGYVAKIWNWLPIKQTFQVKVYGTRVVESKTKQTLVVRDEASIKEKGEVEKTVTLHCPLDESVAAKVVRGIASFYLSFSGTIQLEPWTDLRLQIGDRLAYQSLRYGKVHGVVESLKLSYNGTVEQGLGLLKTTKHNRDSRVQSEIMIGDRPIQEKIIGDYV